MSIAIAALCEYGNAAVVASDHLLTYGNHFQRETEKCTKVKYLSADAIAATTGITTNADEILAPVLSIRLTGHARRQAENTLESYQKWRLNYLIHKHLSIRGLTLEDYHNNRMPQSIFDQVDSAFVNEDIEASIIVVGPEPNKSYGLYKIDHPGDLIDFTAEGFVVEGSGPYLAAQAVVNKAHSKEMKLDDALVLVREAKKLTEIDPYVGEKTTLFVLKMGENDMGTVEVINE